MHYLMIAGGAAYAALCLAPAPTISSSGPNIYLLCEMRGTQDASDKYSMTLTIDQIEKTASYVTNSEYRSPKFPAQFNGDRIEFEETDLPGGKSWNVIDRGGWSIVRTTVVLGSQWERKGTCKQVGR